jgi:hypothetical protein
MATLLGALGGCASFTPPQTAALQARAPAGLPARAELGGTPFYPQTDYHCGPAALATVLGASGAHATPALLADAVFLPARKGSLQVEMLAGARRHGRLASPIPGRMESVMREVAAGRPVVVLQNLGLAIAPTWHYAVVVGYDLARGEMVLRSGTTRREVMSLRTFEHTWARAGHWAFVALAPGELPVDADEAAVTQASVAFERVAPPRESLRAYEAAARRWPGSLTLAIGRGNALYASGARQEAAVAFEATAREHDSAAAWINLGTVALELGRIDEARRAAQRALSLGGTWEAQAKELAARVEAGR